MWTRMVTLALGKFSSSWCFLKIYTADKNFTQPPVAPVAPNINSDIIVIKHQERISINWCDWWKTMYFCWARARQTHNRQYPPSPSPPPLICMHNLVIVLYVTTMTTSNAFGGTQCQNIRIWPEQTISNIFSLYGRQPKLYQNWHQTKVYQLPEKTLLSIHWFNQYYHKAATSEQKTTKVHLTMVLVQQDIKIDSC